MGIKNNEKDPSASLIAFKYENNLEWPITTQTTKNLDDFSKR